MHFYIHYFSLLISGAPDRNETHAEDIVEVAEKMQAWANQRPPISTLGEDGRIKLKIGIHTGRVTAGKRVIFIYEIFNIII
jgi:class 3 adenylate cyclase